MRIKLYGNALNINEQDEAAVVSYLDNEYRKELLNYPSEIPAFDSRSAIWAAVARILGRAIAALP